MRTDQFLKVLGQLVLVVLYYALRQIQYLVVLVNDFEVLDIDEVESLGDGLGGLPGGFFLLVHPLEEEGARLQAQLVQHELGADQPDRCLRLRFKLFTCNLRRLLLNGKLASLVGAEIAHRGAQAGFLFRAQTRR